jgi:hypothetical protein
MGRCGHSILGTGEDRPVRRYEWRLNLRANEAGYANNDEAYVERIQAESADDAKEQAEAYE